mmetsp:Transcript_16082/g.34211  ORF Transcript_16082/g.34211 Transcript_16082/m.34211 type:complete len:428 (-) Transcript_16082:1469-2752(-)
MLEHPPDERVACFVEGDHASLARIDRQVLLLETGDHAVNRRVEALLPDDLQLAPRRDEGRLVAHVGNLGAREAGRQRRHLARVRLDVLVQFDVCQMNRKDLSPALDVWLVYDDLSVEASWTEERGVKDVGPVGARQNHDARRRVEAVQLDEELVERVLALVVAAVEAAAAARAPDRVDLIDKNETRCVGARLREEVPDARGADAHKHLDEVGAGHGVEGRLGLSRRRLCQQRLAAARRADQQGSLGDLGAELRVALWVLQNIHKLHDLDLGFLQSGDVLEARVHLGRLDGLGLANVEDAAAGAAHAAHRATAQHVEEANQQQRRDEAADLGEDRLLSDELDGHVVARRDAELSLHLLEPLLKVFHRSDGEVIGGRRLGGRRGGFPLETAGVGSLACVGDVHTNRVAVDHGQLAHTSSGEQVRVEVLH